MFESLVSAINCFVAIWLSFWFMNNGSGMYAGMAVAIALVNTMFFMLFWFDDDAELSDDEVAQLEQLL